MPVNHPKQLPKPMTEDGISSFGTISDGYSSYDDFPDSDNARDDATLVLLLDIDRALRDTEGYDSTFNPYVKDGYYPVRNPPHVIHPPVRGSSTLVIQGDQRIDGTEERRKVAVKYIVRIFGLHDPDVFFDTPNREIAEPYYLYRAVEAAPQAVLRPLASYSLSPFPGHVLIMPLVEKDLVDLIYVGQMQLQRSTDNTAAVLEELSAQWQFIFARLVRGVAELNRGKVAHMDLKPDKILIVDEMTPKIIDFSSACSSEKQLTGKLVTTFPYAPARCIQRARHIKMNKELECHPYDSDTNFPNPDKIDSFSLGCILFEMYAGRPPNTEDVLESFGDVANQKRHMEIVSTEAGSNSNESDTQLGNECCMINWDGTVAGRSSLVLPNGARDVIRKLVVQDSRQRATAEEILSHRWIQEGLRRSGPENISECSEKNRIDDESNSTKRRKV